MKHYLIIIIIIINSISAKAQDTIIINDTEYAYKSGEGFTYLIDENQHNISIPKDAKCGLYTLIYKNQCVGSINKLSNKESIIYYFDSDSMVNAIEYRPFFKIKLLRINQTYVISSMISYKFIEEMDFNLRDNNFYIGFYDKKHKRNIEILNMELINGN